MRGPAPDCDDASGPSTCVQSTGSDIARLVLAAVGGGRDGRVFVVEQTVEHACEHVDILGAGDGPLVVEHVGGYGGDAVCGGLGEVLHDLCVGLVGFDEAAGGFGIEPDVGGAADEHIDIAHVLAFDEVRLHQPFFDLRLVTVVLGKGDQAMGEQRVGS